MSSNIKKKSTAGGGKFSYKYAELATVHEELERQGITYSQYTEYDERAQADYIFTIVEKDGKKSDPLRGARIIASNTLAGGNAAQQYGSALTYARRYSLLMALGWATEDDDGASAGSMPQTVQQPHTQYGGNRLDFEALKAKLEQIATIAEVEMARAETLRKFPSITEKQRQALEHIFSDRKAIITAANLGRQK